MTAAGQAGVALGRQCFDTIIVGAGSAGSILAARLSEDSERTVCLLEAGPDFPDLESLPPEVRLAGFQGNSRPYMWQFIGQATRLRRDMPVPRGRIVGGSSAINGAILLRGQPEDFDSWAAGGNSEWDYRTCLSYFKKFESDQDYDDEFHGQSGPIGVRRAFQHEWLPSSEAFHNACLDMGFPYCPDFNRPQAWGVGPMPLNVIAGTRVSTAIAYLAPARQRNNLTIKAGVLVRQVLFSGTRACGIELQTHEGQTVRLEGDQVILAAGAIGSPQLLLLSGVGPADQLAALGISPIIDLPGVGQNLRDHPLAHVIWQAKGDSEGQGLPRVYQVNLRAGIDGTEGSDAGYLARSFPGSAEVPPTLHIFVTLMHAESSGQLRLTSADPRTQPLLDYRYLEMESDRARMKSIIRTAVAIGSHAAFDEIRGPIVQPLASDAASDRSLDEWLLRNIGTGMHISGTCRMGPATDRWSVVDQHARVHGADGLLVVDASIMPDCPRANIAAATMMIAERMADVVRGTRDPRERGSDGGISRLNLQAVASPAGALQTTHSSLPS